ncbi:hypothetical protein KKF45_05340 [Patescibacteria group bacterium]|uniref:Uncharacterized protein n=1 Tax=viral metagenome TaxID=1070528 RepID=A0A6M3XP94_9ZZZZ|nr:hypothetical protein [Patescibacteria group bacterium]
MTSKNHKQNTNFQIAYFLAGSCHTADGAFSLLCELREERQGAVDNYKVIQLKDKAREIRAKRRLGSKDKTDQLEGEAELLELENNKKTGGVLYNAALDELDFIDKCLIAIQPLRQYKDLPDAEAHEAAQYQEWKFELMHRAENFLLTIGGIPTDQFATMRMHPAFKTEILPRINEMKKLMLTEKGLEELQKQIGGSKFEDINKLLT